MSIEGFLDRVICGDAVEVMKGLPNDTVHAIVTDPPYGLEFMGEEWDKFKQGENIAGGTISTGQGSYWKERPNIPAFFQLTNKEMLNYQTWTTSWATEALRVLKPGASMLVMGGTRTHHRMMCGVEDAGFEIKDTLVWAYNSGFPKAQDLGKMIDKRLGAEREVVGEKKMWGHNAGTGAGSFSKNKYEGQTGIVRYESITAPASDLARKWDGWKVGGLKPAWEPVVWALKPPESTFIDNVLKHGVGAINVDACRIPYESEDDSKTERKPCPLKQGAIGYLRNDEPLYGGQGSSIGRYPANMLRTDRLEDGYDRFYFVPKADRSERDEGLDGMPEKLFGQSGGAQQALAEGKSEYIQKNHIGLNKIKKVRNVHPTVKPVTLMEHLIKLVTREGQVVLDPFVGSGTTCVAARLLNRHYIGIDMSSEYCEIARHRLAAIPVSLESFQKVRSKNLLSDSTTEIHG